MLTCRGYGGRFRNSEDNHDGETLVWLRFFPRDPENFGTKVFCASCVIRSTAEIAVNAVVTGSVGGQEAFFPLQDHMFLPDGL